MPDLQLADITLHYETRGQGPALLMIPGMLSDHASWQPILAPLEKRFALILPDPRGAGQTAPKDAPLSLATLASDMIALMDHLKHDRFAVLGHSLGALVALAMARRAPARITALIGMAASPAPTARVSEIFRTLLRIRETGGEALFYRALFPWLFHDSFFGDPDAVDTAVAASLAYAHAQPAFAMAHQVAALAQLDLSALPDRPEMPTLALLAQEDALIPVAAAQTEWKARGAESRVLPATGHSPHWDKPDLVVRHILEFLQRGDA